MCPRSLAVLRGSGIERNKDQYSCHRKRKGKEHKRKVDINLSDFEGEEFTGNLFLHALSTSLIN